MTRFLCFADPHIGAGGAHRTDPLADQEAIFEQIAAVAVERKVDGVLIAGDVFHRPRPTPPEMHALLAFSARLEDIPTLAIHGNTGHDLVNGDELSALELFEDVIQVARVPGVHVVAGVRVGALPSTPVHRLVAQTGMSRDEANAAAADLLVKVAEDLREDGATVLLAHWSVTGASLPNGLPVADLNEPVLPLEELEAQGWDAIVLGHIHKRQSFGRRSFYCGSPMTLDFGEADCEHGVTIIDLDPPFLEFVPLSDRRFVTVDVDLPDPVFSAPETDLVVAAVTRPVTDAVIRVRVRASEEQWRRVDTAAINRFLTDAGAHKWTVTPEITRAARARVEGVDESLSPQDAVSAWLAAQKLEKPQRDGVLALLDAYLETV